MLPDRKHAIATLATHANRSPPLSGLAASELAARYGTAGRRVVLYAGTFEPYQGLELLVDAAPMVTEEQPDAAFLCIGGHQAQIAELRRRACDTGVEAHFILPGVVPADDVEAHFALADILVSPRIAGTNTPLKIYSYLRSGVPIVATNIRSHTQVLTPAVALLVEPHPDAIAAGILRLLEDRDLGRQLTRNALKLAQEKFSIEAYYAKVAQVYAFLEARKAPRAI
jgi:glycosyltransferase involved in cell wall biosynthesis